MSSIGGKDLGDSVGGFDGTPENNTLSKPIRARGRLDAVIPPA